MVRSGRVSLMYRTVEGDETGYWDNGAKQWVADPTVVGAIEDALGIAKEERAPDLITCPYRRRKEADREPRFEEPAGALDRGIG